MGEKRLNYVRTKIWDTESNAEFFPELDDPEYCCDWVKARRSFGVAFSGGGTRSASATLGQLRAIRSTGLLDKLGYISAVSGGSWASTPFTFLPSQFTDDDFLGEQVSPENLTIETLDTAPRRSLALAISESVIGDDFLRNFLKSGDEAYARAVGNVFLKPFGLNDASRFFTFHENALRATLEVNSQHRDSKHYLTEGDFYLARNDRPYLIVSGVIQPEEDGADLRSRKLHCEYTPIYTGVRARFPNAGADGDPIGGGYIQSFAYDSKSPKSAPVSSICRVKLGKERYRFTLGDVIGSSGAAPAEHIRKLSKGLSVGFPEFRHWSPSPANTVGTVREEEYAHTDGGHLENLGIMPLLARQVKSILVFINTRSPFSPRSFTGQLSPLFGREDHVDLKKDAEKLATNQVFESSRLDDLIAAFANRLDQSGKPASTLIHADTYRVLDNEQYKIRSYEARICWVYNAKVEQWRRQLTDEVRTLLDEDSEFKRFPHYKTFGENPPNIIDLSIRQVNLLAHLSCWNVMENADYIRQELEL